MIKKEEKKFGRWEKNVEAIIVLLAAEHGTDRAGAGSVWEENTGGKLNHLFHPPPSSREGAKFETPSGCFQLPWELLVTLKY